MPNKKPVNDPSVNVQSAMKLMQNRLFINTPAYHQQQLRANRVGAHPDILEFSRKLVIKLADLGIPVFPHCIVRSYDEQNAAYLRGVSKDSPEDGYWPHKAFAVDIIHSKLGWMDAIPLSREAWRVIGHCGDQVALSMGIKIKWGGRFTFYDPAHFELELARNDS